MVIGYARDVLRMRWSIRPVRQQLLMFSLSARFLLTELPQRTSNYWARAPLSVGWVRHVIVNQPTYVRSQLELLSIHCTGLRAWRDASSASRNLDNGRHCADSTQTLADAAYKSAEQVNARQHSTQLNS